MKYVGVCSRSVFIKSKSVNCNDYDLTRRLHCRIVRAKPEWTVKTAYGFHTQSSIAFMLHIITMQGYYMQHTTVESRMNIRYVGLRTVNIMNNCTLNKVVDNGGILCKW